MKPATYPGRYMLARTLLILILALACIAGIGALILAPILRAPAFLPLGLALAGFSLAGLVAVGEEL